MSAHSKIIFNELERAKEILQNGFEKGAYSRYELGILAKYWIYEGKSKAKAKKELIKFCKEKSVGFNEVSDMDEINRAISVSQKYSLKIANDFVGITQLELNMILSLPYRYARLMFVMLVLAKINKKYPTKSGGGRLSDGYYCQTDLIQVMRIAKTYFTPAELMSALRFLDNEVNFISPTYNAQVYAIFVIEEGGEDALIIDDFDNIIDFFPIVCQNCGKPIIRTGARQKYCKECWKEEHKKQKRNWWNQNH